MSVEEKISKGSNSEESELSISENIVIEECKDEEKSELSLSEILYYQNCKDDKKMSDGCADIAMLVVLKIEDLERKEVSVDVPQLEQAIFGCDGSKVFDRGKYTSGGNESAQKKTRCYSSARTWNLDQASVQVRGSMSCKREEKLDQGECGGEHEGEMGDVDVKGELGESFASSIGSGDSYSDNLSTGSDGEGVVVVVGGGDARAQVGRPQRYVKRRRRSKRREDD